MKNEERILKSLESIEFLLQSIHELLEKPANLVLTRQDRAEVATSSKIAIKHDNQLNHSITDGAAENTKGGNWGDKIPEMVSLQEAAKRTGLSYYYLRSECLKGNLVYLRIGSGKILINFDYLIDKMNNNHGALLEKVDEERGK